MSDSDICGMREHEAKNGGINMIELKKLWNAMPRDVQRKTSLHDLKRIVDAYNSASPESSRYTVATDYPEHTVYDRVKKRDLFPTRSGNRGYQCLRCYQEDAVLIAQALNQMESRREADAEADEMPEPPAENAIAQTPGADETNLK